jgi:mannose-6-phosphate isomerase
MTGALPLTNPVRTYAWGSHTVLPELLGEPSPAAEPWAEVWIGAHPADPSRLPDGRTLAEVEPRLPFLVKLLAAAEPLSIQAHPDLARARHGYAEEEARGVAVDAAERSYRDANHKPELLVALDRTEALCGFRSPEDVLVTAERIGSDSLTTLLAALRSDPGAPALRETFGRLLRLEPRARGMLIADVVAHCGTAADQPGHPDHALAAWVRRLADAYPDDAGVLTPLLLRLVVLEPGDGLFLAAGVLHSYLRGVGVEVQASSDNVVRGGLTPKPVDVDELLRVLAPGDPPLYLVRPRLVSPGLDAYDVPVGDFSLFRVRLGGSPVEVEVTGPRLVVCVAGQVDVLGTPLTPGRAAYVPADCPQVLVNGDGVAFVAAGG